MDAIGANAPEPEPDDNYLFNAIVRDFKVPTFEQAARQAAAEASAPEPAPAPELAPDVVPQPGAGADRRSSDTAEPTDATAAEPDTPRPASEKEPAVVPGPPPAATLSPPPAAPVPPLVELDTPAELVVPEKPVRKSSMIDWCAKAFPHLVWLSVIAGLVGQVYGWSKTFGGGPVGWIVAGTLGGVFEFIMVAASSKGLKDLGLGRGGGQVAAFLFVGTACAALAFGMNLMHFTGELAMAGIAAAAATALGYLAHVGVHYFEELDNRKILKVWEVKAAAIRRQIEVREAKARADHDAMQAEARKLQLAQMGQQVQARLPQPTRLATAADTPPLPRASKSSSAKPVAKGGGRAAKKPDKPSLDRETVRAWAKNNPAAGSGAIRRHFLAEGYEVPVDRTIRRYLEDDTTKK